MGSRKSAQNAKRRTTPWRIMALTWRHPLMVIITIAFVLFISSSAPAIRDAGALGQAVDRAEGVPMAGQGGGALWTTRSRSLIAPSQAACSRCR